MSGSPSAWGPWHALEDAAATANTTDWNEAAEARHRDAMTRRPGKFCSKVKFSEQAEFQLCPPPGALKPKFFERGVEHDIGVAFETIVVEAGGWADRPWVIDVGMNEGFFTLLPASLGARVVSFELQPDCMPSVQSALNLSGLGSAAVLKNVGIASGHSDIKMHAKKCNPLNSVDGRNFGTGEVVMIALMTAMEALQEFGFGKANPISLFKIDAEGAEIGILKGSLELIKIGAIHRMVTEVSPQWWHRLGVSPEDGIATLEAATAAGDYTLYVFPRENGLGPGLAGDTHTIAGVEGLREVNDVAAFVRNRIAVRSGCNLLWDSRE